jgi:hypothetical protein
MRLAGVIALIGTTKNIMNIFFFHILMLNFVKILISLYDNICNIL